MKRIAITLLVILLVNVCFSTTVYLRKGGTVEGEVISKDDEKLVIKTADGEKTLKWRQLKNKSIEEIHPELYEKLKVKALEKKINKDGKVTKEKKNDIDFSRIHLSVVKTEKGGAYKKVNIDLDLDKYSSSVKREWKSIRFYEKECYGKISIKLNGLDSKKKKEYGDKADGWDISIWLNDTLIYKEINRKCRMDPKNILH